MKRATLFAVAVTMLFAPLVEAQTSQAVPSQSQITAVGDVNHSILNTQSIPFRGNHDIAPDSVVKRDATPRASDIVSVAEANQSLSMFVMAVQTAGLTRTLREGGPFTVFALDNRAFASLPSEERRILLEQPAAMHILLASYIVQQDLFRAKPETWLSTRTMNGKKLRLDLRTEGVFVNSAKLSDLGIIPCSNGTILVLRNIDLGLVHEAVSILQRRTQ